MEVSVHGRKIRRSGIYFDLPGIPGAVRTAGAGLRICGRTCKP